MTHGKVESKHFEKYGLFLVEKYRPPSRGGNTNALHSHTLTIEGERYGFLALGSQQWAYKYDTVSFEYEVKDGYKNILIDTFVAISKSGSPIIRGNRGFKHTLRKADTKMPASHSEQRD